MGPNKCLYLKSYFVSQNNEVSEQWDSHYNILRFMCIGIKVVNISTIINYDIIIYIYIFVCNPQFLFALDANHVKNVCMRFVHNDYSSKDTREEQ